MAAAMEEIDHPSEKGTQDGRLADSEGSDTSPAVDKRDPMPLEQHDQLERLNRLKAEYPRAIWAAAALVVILGACLVDPFVPLRSLPLTRGWFVSSGWHRMDSRTPGQ